MLSIPDSTTVMIISSIPEHLNVLVQGEHARGKLHISGFGTFSFDVKNFGTPNAPIVISTEDQREVLMSVHFGLKPEILECASNVFIYRCFLTAWTAKRGHPSGYLDRPVPFPLPPELQQEVGPVESKE
jgi:hypothetical protein